MSAENKAPAILWADADLLVIDKPAGLLSVPGRGADKQDCLARRVQAIYPEALNVHRLDMETSGLIVMALGKAMHRALSMAFEKRQVEKRYTAIVAGEIAANSGEIDLPLICDWPKRPRQIVDFAIGKPSLTRYELLTRDKTSSRLALYPVTGRSHQLRVHLQAIGHPILGDSLYAPPESSQRAARLLLHADRIGLPHPRTGAWLEFDCPAPF